MQHLFEVERGVAIDGRLIRRLHYARYAKRYFFTGKAKAMVKARELVRNRYPDVLEKFRKEAMEKYAMGMQDGQYDEEVIGQYVEDSFERFFMDNWHDHIWYATENEVDAPYQLRIYSDAKKYRMSKQKYLKAKRKKEKEMGKEKNTQMRTHSTGKLGRPKKIQKDLENNSE